LALNLTIVPSDAMECLPLPACLLDESFHVTCGNHAFRSVMGGCRDSAHATTRPFSDLVIDEDRALVEAFLSNLTIDIGEPGWLQFEFRSSTGDGPTSDYEALAYRCRDTGQIAVILLDRTESKQRGANIESAVLQLKDDNRRLEHFTQEVAHDLKRPLVTMDANLRLLRSHLDAGNSTEVSLDLEEILGAVEHMQVLLQELFDLSRIGRLDLFSRTKDVEFRPVDLNEAVQQAIRAVFSGDDASLVQIETTSTLPTVHGRPKQLVEVFQNLLDNAQKYAGRDRRVRVWIGCEERHEELVIFVRDDGPGVSIDDRERIFELFAQGENADEGSGIGLAIVRRIIEAHGGRVWVEADATGGGACFCFTLGCEPTGTGQARSLQGDDAVLQ
jgi:signal transduction histidine kinase